MSDKFTLRRPSSPLLSRHALLHSGALTRKIWLKADGSGGNDTVINQPTAVEFEETDTVDDLKTAFLNKLAHTRWATNRDNTCISIGCYCNCDESTLAENLLSPTPQPKTNNEEGSNNTNLLDLERISSISPHTKSKIAVQQPTPTSPKLNQSTLLVRPKALSPELSNALGSNVSRNNSPMVNNQPPKISLQHHLSPFQINTVPAQTLAYIHNTLGRRGDPPRFTPSPSTNNSSRRSSRTQSLQLHVNTVSPSITAANIVPNEMHKVFFEPDELVINIYNDLFGNYGLQKAADALVVYFNPTLKSHVPIKQEEHTIFENMPAEMDIPESQEEPQQYKLITDQEQLRKVSHNMGIDIEDENVDSPKQAILLLPKDFTGNVDLSTTASSPSTETIGTPDGIEVPGDPLALAHLVEEEVGSIPAQSATFENAAPGKIYPQRQSQLPSPDTTKKNTKNTRENVFPKINVLIVEDNVINQAILGSFLRKHKISYKVAKNGREAVDKWKQGGIHLILLDLQLPILSGIEATKEIRNLEKLNGIGNQRWKEKGEEDERSRVKTKPSSGNPKSHPPQKRKQKSKENEEPLSSSSSSSSLTSSLAPSVDENKLDRSMFRTPVIIVALTASNSQTDKTEALIAGCNDYLTKPVNLDWLSNKITEWGCMQALIDFDGWKHGQRRMTDNVKLKPQIPGRKPQSVSVSSTKLNRMASLGNSGIVGNSTPTSTNPVTPTEVVASTFKPVSPKQV